MKSFFIVFQIELLKLRRTLTLWMAIAAPLVVNIMETVILVRRGQGSSIGSSIWLDIYNSTLSIWVIFMGPLLIALVAALVYNSDHAHHGWYRMHTLPFKRWTIPTAKLAVILILLLISTICLLGGSLIATRFAALINGKIMINFPIPWQPLISRSIIAFLSMTLIIAIQNAISFHWSTVSVSLGVGIAGSFIALSAAGWKYGYLFPWLLPMSALHGDLETVLLSVILSIVVGGALMIGTIVYASWKDPGLYQ